MSTYLKPVRGLIFLAAACWAAPALAQDVESVTVTEDVVRLLRTDASDTAFGLSKPLLETPRAVHPDQRHHHRALWHRRRGRSHRHHAVGLYRQLLWRGGHRVAARHPGGELFPRLQAGGKPRHLCDAAGQCGGHRDPARPPSPVYGAGKVGGWSTSFPRRRAPAMRSAAKSASPMAATANATSPARSARR